MDNNSKKIEDYLITSEPYYEPVGNEISIFESAYQNQLPVLLKGPTGCGKTRFMEHMRKTSANHHQATVPNSVWSVSW